MSDKPALGRAIGVDGTPLVWIGCPLKPGHICEVWVAPAQDALWRNEGTQAAPTLNPSYNCVGGCGWHGYIVDGKTCSAPPPPVISSIHVCSHCKAPELIIVTPSINVRGALGLSIGVTELRTGSAPPSVAGVSEPTDDDKAALYEAQWTAYRAGMLDGFYVPDQQKPNSYERAVVLAESGAKAYLAARTAPAPEKAE